MDNLGQGCQQRALAEINETSDFVDFVMLKLNELGYLML